MFTAQSEIKYLATKELLSRIIPNKYEYVIKCLLRLTPMSIKPDA